MTTDARSLRGNTRSGDPLTPSPAAVLDESPRAAAASDAATRVATPILLDAHAHYYDCFNAATFLDHAAANFAHAAPGAGIAPGTPALLVVASTSRGDGFAALRDLAAAGRAGPWRITPTEEDASLLASRTERPELILIAGRQIITAERLEVLALACAAPIRDGMSLHDTVRAAHATGAVVVLPWGFGKWTFQRAKVVRRFLESLTPELGGQSAKSGGDAAPPGALFLGDTANRPHIGLGEHALLRHGRARGLHVLPGTDPLPLASCQSVAGRYGCVVNINLDTARPAAALRSALANPQMAPVPFGRRLPLAAFVRTQAALRLSGRLQPAPAPTGEGVDP